MGNFFIASEFLSIFQFYIKVKLIMIDRNNFSYVIIAFLKKSSMNNSFNYYSFSALVYVNE